MYVILKFGNKVKIVPGVGLRECYLPTIGSTQMDFQMEPAIWFKTLLVDQMMIDCDKREVRWRAFMGTDNVTNVDSRSNASAELQVSEQDVDLDPQNFPREVYENAECYDFDPLVDEVFDTVHMMMAENKKLNTEQFNIELLRLFHCLILPALKLSRQDIEALDNAKEIVDAELISMDAGIVDKQKCITLTENSLERQRERFLEKEQFSSETYVRTCKRDFLQNLLKHIEKDIAAHQEHLIEVQGTVDKLRDESHDVSLKRLNSFREERDQIHEHIKKLQTVRETIKNVTCRHHVKTKAKYKIKESLFHDVYFEISNRLMTEKHEIHLLCLKKVKISSVREAILIALNDLDTEEETVGVHVRVDGGSRVTDILEPTQKPKEWLTLEERIASVLVVQSTDAFKEYNEFCDMLTDKIGEILHEIKFFSMNRQNSIQFINTMGYESKTRRAGGRRSHSRASETSLDQLARHSLCTFQETLKQISSDTKDHINKMCHLLYNSMPEYSGHTTSKNFYSKMWVCYESHLYNRLMGSIENIYETVYKTGSSNLNIRMSNLSLAELGISEAMILRMVDFDQKQELETPSPEFEETQVKRPFPPTDLFLRNTKKSDSELKINSPDDLQRLSIKQLYKIANAEGSSLETLSIPYSISDITSEIKSNTIEPVEQFGTPPENCNADISDSREVSSDYSSCTCSLGSTKGATNVIIVCEECKSKSNNVEPKKEDELPPYSQASSVENLPPTYEESLDIAILQSFSPFINHLQSVIKAPYVLNKLKLITKAFRCISEYISRTESSLRCDPDPYLACCDEILTVIIVLLRCLSSEDFTKLYAHLNLMIDLMAPFMIGSVHDCSLTNFIGAYQYLFDRQLLHQSVQQSRH